MRTITRLIATGAVLAACVTLTSGCLHQDRPVTVQTSEPGSTGTGLGNVPENVQPTDDASADSAKETATPAGSRTETDAAVVTQIVPWLAGDCGTVELSDPSLAGWCASQEPWALRRDAPRYVCPDGSAPRTPDKIRSRPASPAGQPWGPWSVRTLPCPDAP